MKTGIMGLLLTGSQALAAGPAPVSLVVDEVPVAQLLQALAEQENRNMIISPDVSGNVSLRLQEVPWLQAIQTVVTGAGLVMRQQAGIFLYPHRRLAAATAGQKRGRANKAAAQRAAGGAQLPPLLC